MRRWPVMGDAGDVTRQVLILGAGFGGLELSTLLSERLADKVEITLIDQNDSFMFGFSKLDIVFRGRTWDQVRIPYVSMARPGVQFRQETVVSIDPKQRRVVTDSATYDADVLVVALGADYDQAATPGLVEGGFEYYSMAGAERLRDELPSFTGGRVLLSVLSIPFKCPPAPYEGILLLHDYLVERGIREATQMHVITPQPSPIPVSPEASAAVEQAMAERGISYTKRHRVYGIDPATNTARLKDHEEPYDLFIGVPVHKAPAVLTESGLTQDGWVRVDRRTHETQFAGVFAIGDCTETGIPKAGVFAEAAAQALAGTIEDRIKRSDDEPSSGTSNAGAAQCFLEFGRGEVGRVDVDFLAPGGPTAPLRGPGPQYVQEKEAFGAIRRTRWFAE